MGAMTSYRRRFVIAGAAVLGLGVGGQLERLTGLGKDVVVGQGMTSQQDARTSEPGGVETRPVKAATAWICGSVRLAAHRPLGALINAD